MDKVQRPYKAVVEPRKKISSSKSHQNHWLLPCCALPSSSHQAGPCDRVTPRVSMSVSMMTYQHVARPRVHIVAFAAVKLGGLCAQTSLAVEIAMPVIDEQKELGRVERQGGRHQGENDAPGVGAGASRARETVVAHGHEPFHRQGQSEPHAHRFTHARHGRLEVVQIIGEREAQLAQLRAFHSAKAEETDRCVCVRATMVAHEFVNTFTRALKLMCMHSRVWLARSITCARSIAITNSASALVSVLLIALKCAILVAPTLSHRRVSPVEQSQSNGLRMPCHPLWRRKVSKSIIEKFAFCFVSDQRFRWRESAMPPPPKWIVDAICLCAALH